MIYRIAADPVFAHIEEGSARLADRLLAVEDPKAQQSAARVLRLTDGLIHYVDRETGRLPAGLVPRLQRRLEKRGHKVSITWSREIPAVTPVPEDYVHGITMRDYQVGAANAGLEARRGLLWLATNAGKSAVIASIVGKIVREARERVVVVVPTAYLLTQTYNDIRGFLGPSVTIGRLGDGHRPSQSDKVIISTFQTLVGVIVKPKREPWLKQFVEAAGAVIVDEAQYAGASSIQKILETAVRAEYRIGLTGTVDKRDLVISAASDVKAKHHRRELEKYLGPVLYRVTNEELVERGFSARPTIYLVEDRNAFGPDIFVPKPRPGGKPVNPYHFVYTHGIIKSRRYHKTVGKVAATLLDQGKPPFVFSHSVDHIDALAAVLEELGVPHVAVSSKASVPQRMAVVERFIKRQNFAVLASPVFDVGVSLPAIRAVILAGARKLPVELLQRIGRGLRAKKDGDNTVTVVDFACLQSRILHKHYLSRVATYESEGFAIERIADISSIGSITFP